MNVTKHPALAGKIAFACFVVGFLIIFPVEAWWAQLFGMLFLTTGVVLGCIAIFTPRFLSEEPREEELPPSRP